MSKKYGISKVNFGGDKNESTLVQFGDGLTAIQSITYDNGDFGVVIVRDGSFDKPFGINEKSDSYAHDTNDGKVIIAFDNPRSVDVLIARLLEAKEMAEELKEE